MPQIKQYTRQILPTALSRTQVRASDIGGDQSGLRQLAGATQGLANVLEEKKLKAEKSDYLAKLAKFQEENLLAQQELSTAEFEEGADIGELYKQNLNERAERLQIPKSMQDRWQADVADMSLGFMQAGMKNQAQRAGQKAKLDWENSVQSLSNVVSLDPSKIDMAKSILGEQINNFNIAPEDKAAILDGAIDNIQQNRAAALATNTPEQFIKDAKKGKYNDIPNITNYITTAENQIKSNEAERKRAQTERRQRLSDQVDVLIYNTGDVDNEELVTQNDLDQLLRDKEIDTGMYLQKSKALDVALQRRFKSQQDIQTFDYLSNGGLFNPDDKKHQEALDTFYEKSIVPLYQDMPPNDVITHQVGFVTRQGALPTAMKNQISTALYSGDSEQKIIASNIVTDVIKENPSLARQFDNKDIAFSMKVTSAVNSGLSGDDAIEFAQSQTFLSETPEYKSRNEVFRREGADFKRGNVDPFFIGNPDDVPVEMKAEWKELYRFASVVEGLDDKDAQEFAYNNVKSTWGVSTLTGTPVYKKWAPEIMYKVEGASDNWIQKQLMDLMNTDDLSGIEVIPDIRTVRSGKPAYQIAVKTVQDGQIFLDSARDEAGQPIYWRPSYEETEEYKGSVVKHNKQQEKDLVEFNERRERELKARKFIETGEGDFSLDQRMGLKVNELLRGL